MTGESRFAAAAGGEPPSRPDGPGDAVRRRHLRLALIAVAGMLALGALTVAVEQQLDDRARAQERAESAEGVARREDLRQQRVVDAVRDGRLPPVALDMLDPSGGLQWNIVDGPHGGEDVVRTRDGGERGPTLRWDLDGDGRILGDERAVTEQELYHEVLEVRYR